MRPVLIFQSLAIVAAMQILTMSFGSGNASAVLPVSSPSFSSFDPFLGLTAEDKTIMQNTIVQKLVPQNVDGAFAEWSNPNSGSSGRVTFVRRLTIASRPCREIAYEISTKQTDHPVRYVYTRCRDTDGTWKFD